jgi:hypothetical protein
VRREAGAVALFRGFHASVTHMGKPVDAGPVWITVGGTIELGLIDDAAAAAVHCIPGPVRLPKGFGGPKGHGLLHIQQNEGRMKQIQGIGYATATLFVAEIAGKWTKIAQANEPGRLVLVYSIAGYDLRLIVQRYTAGPKQCWSGALPR